MLIGPATIFVTIGLLIPIVILFRYSLNQFVPGKMMVEAWTFENYVLFFTDPSTPQRSTARCGSR
jgi:putative spermidine/putrescine transport system permease protein